jgi:Protein of unknown function (DUF3014)
MSDEKEDLEDFEIDTSSPPAEGDAEPAGLGPGDQRRDPALPWGMILTGLALVGAIGAVVFILMRPGPKATVSPPATSTSPASPAPSEPPVSLPALADSDAFVRDAAKGLSTHPQLGAWLAARGLVRTLTVSLQNIGEGRSPALFLPFLTPTMRFQAVQKGSILVADPKSYAAYDDFADGVAALDAAECARVYKVLAPLFAAAYADLGYPGPEFPKAVARAVAVLGATPVPDSDVALRRGPAFLLFADPKLEGLSLAQKHLLRMGPRNARLIQKKAAEVAQALGLPPHS